MIETRHQVVAIEIPAGQDLVLTINGKPVAYVTTKKQNETTYFYGYGISKTPENFMDNRHHVSGFGCGSALEVSNPDLQSVLAEAVARFGSN